MAESTRQKAEVAGQQIAKANAVVLVEPKADVVPLAKAEVGARADIEAKIAELDIGNTRSIVSFGASAQEGMQKISQDMLAGVRNKNVGPAGEALRNMVTSIRGFSIAELDTRRKRSFWERLTGAAAPMAKFMARYETVQTQIDSITEELLDHEHDLMKDIKSLDKLYGRTLEFYDQIGVYIAAGSEVLARLDADTLPAKEMDIAAADENRKVIAAQELRDLRSARDDLDRRVHDLKLTRAVTMQSLPSIRLVQENDKSLVTKINSTLVNTVPLWETQLAQSVTIQRSADAAEIVKEAADLTSELLKANAANLRTANRSIRREIERGVFDIVAIKEANADLIATIEESLQIADEGKANRAAAETELKKMEIELRTSLAAAKSSKTGTGEALGTSVGPE